MPTETEKGFHGKLLDMTKKPLRNRLTYFVRLLKPLLGWHGARLNFLASSPHCPIESRKQYGSHVFGDVLGDESWGMVAFSHSSQGALSDARVSRARVAPQSEETWAKRKKSFLLWF